MQARESIQVPSRHGTVQDAEAVLIEGIREDCPPNEGVTA